MFTVNLNESNLPFQVQQNSDKDCMSVMVQVTV